VQVTRDRRDLVIKVVNSVRDGHMKCRRALLFQCHIVS
jgi:hypothetical protein